MIVYNLPLVGIFVHCSIQLRGGPRVESQDQLFSNRLVSTAVGCLDDLKEMQIFDIRQVIFNRPFPSYFSFKTSLDDCENEFGLQVYFHAF